ncbi:hypothetical protein BGZ94_002472 [Podila epigama]|nr:hypothetical protein BGZ94_002472 [Podila epigama]
MAHLQMKDLTGRVMASLKQYNILFLGVAQSGKTTLIEALKKYADPNHVINKSRIGNGARSCTSEVIAETITTNLPSHFVTDASSGDSVDYGAFFDMDQDDYVDELNDRRSYLLDREQSTKPNVVFNLIDTPGLNDINLSNEANMSMIFEALKSIETIHLVVVTVPVSAFTGGIRDALNAYVDLLPAFNGNFVFVHTRIAYAQLHPEEPDFEMALTEKKSILNSILKRDSAPHLLIDNDFGSNYTIRNCITQNTLRNLLAMAKFNQPVALQTMMMNKTQRMLVVDEIVCDKIKTLIQDREKTLEHKNKEEKAILERMNVLKTSIAEKEQKLNDIDMQLTLTDQNTLELLHEEHYQQDFSFLNLREKCREMHYPGEPEATNRRFIHHILDHIDIRSHNIRIVDVKGGVNEKFWAVLFRRRRAQNGVYHVKIYIKKKKKYAIKIEEWKSQQMELQGLLEDHKDELKLFEEQEQQRQEEVRFLLDELKKDQYILSRASAKQLNNKVFGALVKANVFELDYSKSALNIESFYRENKDKLEVMESNVGFVIPPVEDKLDISEDAGYEGIPDYEDELEDFDDKKVAEDLRNQRGQGFQMEE